MGKWDRRLPVIVDHVRKSTGKWEGFITPANIQYITICSPLSYHVDVNQRHTVDLQANLLPIQNFAAGEDSGTFRNLFQKLWISAVQK
jgi:hypothetical protein